MNDLSSFNDARPGDFGIIGDPVAHSLSPAFQNAALNQWWRTQGRDPNDLPVYRLFPVTPADVPAALTAAKQRKLAGLNVTVPHKTAVVPYLDDLHSFAKRVGAVNTIKNENGRLVGHNTDGLGFERAVTEDMAVTPDVALVLGAGGTGQVIVHQLLAMDVHRVYWWNRTPSKIEAQLEKIRDEDRVRLVDDEEIEQVCRESDLFINATSVGLEEGDGLPAPGLVFSDQQAAFDVVYHRRTAFLEAAKAAGALVCGGLPMLLHQGAAAFEIWTGANAPVDLMRRALDAALKEKGINPVWPSDI
jgi:shikimate dehydrogenase